MYQKFSAQLRTTTHLKSPRCMDDIVPCGDHPPILDMTGPVRPRFSTRVLALIRPRELADAEGGKNPRGQFLHSRET